MTRKREVPPESHREARWFHWAVGASLVGLVALAHGGAARGAFHYDDFHAIVENQALRTWDPIAYFSSSQTFSARDVASGYRPVTVTTLALSFWAGGMNPFSFLLVNLVLHAAVAWLVYLVGRRLFDDARWAAVAAVVYAIHPVDAEAVNYVTARSSLLAACFSLVALWALLRLAEGARWGLTVALAAYALALLSKEAALALLPPVLCLAWVSRASRPRASFGQGEAAVGAPLSRLDLPLIGSFLILSAAFVVLWRWMAEGVTLTSASGAAYPLWAFLEIMVRSLGLWLWPWPLGLDHPVVFAEAFGTTLALVCVGVLGLLAGLVAWTHRRVPLIAWIMVWIMSGFLPLLPLPWMTTQALFQENRLAFSAVGLAWLTAWLARWLWTRVANRIGNRRIVWGIGLGLATLALSGAVALDRSRAWTWSDDARLWEEVLRHRPADPVASANLGSVYYVRGALGPAERAFERALEQDPDYLWAALHLGLIHAQRGQWASAEEVLARALQRSGAGGEGASRSARRPTGGHPGDVQKIRLALAYVYLSRGESQRAQSLYEEATRADSTDFRAWYNLGVVAEQRGMIETARDAYRRALALSPNEAQISAAVRRLDVEK